MASFPAMGRVRKQHLGEATLTFEHHAAISVFLLIQLSSEPSILLELFLRYHHWLVLLNSTQSEDCAYHSSCRLSLSHT